MKKYLVHIIYLTIIISISAFAYNKGAEADQFENHAEQLATLAKRNAENAQREAEVSEQSAAMAKMYEVRATQAMKMAEEAKRDCDNKK